MIECPTLHAAPKGTREYFIWRRHCQRERRRGLNLKLHLRKSSCSGKVRHPTETVARDVIAGIRAQRRRYHDRYLEAYQCIFCFAWHIGHRPPDEEAHARVKRECLLRELLYRLRLRVLRGQGHETR